MPYREVTNGTPGRRGEGGGGPLVGRLLPGIGNTSFSYVHEAIAGSTSKTLLRETVQRSVKTSLDELCTLSCSTRAITLQEETVSNKKTVCRRMERGFFPKIYFTLYTLCLYFVGYFTQDFVTWGFTLLPFPALNRSHPLQEENKNRTISKNRNFLIN
jgi:hypothetical protein